MDYCQKLMYLFETDASVDEIIDCACMMGPHEPCSTRIELLILYFLEDKEDELGLSKEAYYFIGGIMKHIKGMAAITNPLVNSYKRLVLLQLYLNAFLQS